MKNISLILLDRFSRSIDVVFETALARSGVLTGGSDKSLRVFEFYVLLHVTTMGRFGTVALAKSLGLAPRGLSTTLLKLQTQGFVERRKLERKTRRDPVSQVLLTDKGHALLDKVRGHIDRFLMDKIGCMDPLSEDVLVALATFNTSILGQQEGQAHPDQLDMTFREHVAEDWNRALTSPRSD